MNTPIRLSQDALKTISHQTKVPLYDRSVIKTGIVHIGVGGFHRSHEAYYLHQLLAKGLGNDWGICGVGLRSTDSQIIKVLEQQQGLYSLITRHPNGTVENEVIGSITEYLLGTTHADLVVDRLSSEETKIVSLTITEGGYNFQAATESFDFTNPAIQHDLTFPHQPKTVFGFVAAGLRLRKAHGIPPFTILSCDNIQHNGDMARKMFLSFIEKLDPNLHDWVAAHGAFPNTMVDRITPVSTTEDSQYLEVTFGYHDEWPVTCEPFIQWVVEDHFSMGRPPLEQVGVQFVPDVKPYEKMKLRLLNAGHSVLGIPGALHGHPTIGACMQDEVFATFMRSFMDTEATPTLDSVPGIDLTAYKNTLEERFANPNMKDSVARICSESSAKLPKFLVSTLEDNLKRGGEIRHATLVLAAWCYYSDKQQSQAGEKLDISDALKDDLHAFAQQSTIRPLAFLEYEPVFGTLKTNTRFVAQYTEYIQQLYASNNIRGIMQTLIA